MSTEPAIKSDWWFVGYDETHHWAFKEIAPDLFKRFVRRIIGVYACDRAEQTHCCEITPSHWMIAIANEVVFNEQELDIAEHREGFDADRFLEKVLDLVREVWVSESDHYHHVKAVDRYIAARPELTYQVGDVDEDRDKDNGEVIDRLHEIWNSGPKF